MDLKIGSGVGLMALVIGYVFYGISDWVSSAISDRVGRRPVILTGGIAYAVWAFPMFAMVDAKSPVLIVVAMANSLTLTGMIYGPLAWLISELSLPPNSDTAVRRWVTSLARPWEADFRR